MEQSLRIAAGSIVVGLAVLALKGTAYWITSSAAIYSDAIETVTNVAASTVAFLAVRFAARPADSNHPYGHEKAEFFAAVIEAALIIVAALLILQHAWATWRDPAPITTPWRGIALVACATAFNAGWAALLFRVGRRARSAALVADGRHLSADVVTSVGVSAGLALAVLTGMPQLDPLLAAATAVYVLGSGVRLMGNSVGGLMDAAPDVGVVERIRALVGEHARGAIEVHDLRTRHAGRVTFVDFHLVVPGAMSVAESHDICDRIEDALRQDAEVGGERLAITIHVEPEGKAKHQGVLVL